jgi:hypothetical protein
MSKLIFKIIKFIVFFAVAIGLSIAAYLGYIEYEKVKKSEAELNFKSENTWAWHDKYDHIQIQHIEWFGGSMLRRVYMDKTYLDQDHVIYAYKNSDYSLSAEVDFYVSCEPNSEIKTSEKFSSGKSKILKCSSLGDKLTFSVSWSDKKSDFRWAETLDGFNFSVDFSYWDFDKLDQEITLSKAESKVSAN